MISIPLFNKQPEELKTIMDQWLYLLKHLSTMDRLPLFLDNRIFGLTFEIGEMNYSQLILLKAQSFRSKMSHRRKLFFIGITLCILSILMLLFGVGMFASKGDYSKFIIELSEFCFISWIPFLIIGILLVLVSIILSTLQSSKIKKP